MSDGPLYELSTEVTCLKWFLVCATSVILIGGVSQDGQATERTIVQVLYYQVHEGTLDFGFALVRDCGDKRSSIRSSKFIVERGSVAKVTALRLLLLLTQ
jgi:hypothetical protein